MSVLDDLEVCTIRTKLRIELRQAGRTPSEEEGRKQHIDRLERILKRLHGILRRRGLKVLHKAIEDTVEYRYSTTTHQLLFTGQPDIVVLVAKDDALAVINVEYSTYLSSPETVLARQLLYATALYNHYGFPVLPVLLVEAANRLHQYFLCPGRNWETWLQKRLSLLARLVTDEAKLRPPNSPSVCASCPPRIRGLCPAKEV